MFDAGLLSERTQPRAIGAAAVGAARRGCASTLAGLRQQGSAKIFLPGVPGDALEAVLLNTAGGITGGDRFRWSADAAAGARLVITTQAAERAYRAQDSELASVETRLEIAAGARIDWLPQETILFDRSALSRRIEVDMEPDATLVLAESVVLGRRAMGERVRSCRFSDQWRIRRGGRLVHADALRIWGETAGLAAPAALGGATAFASIVMVAPDVADRLDPVRRLLADAPGVEAGASAFDGCLVLRMLAEDGYALRPALLRLLTCLCGRPLPRVWSI
ncbi:MAG TPA: urease accessory protein UreD [Thermohalobaculum sp.]|nr:urease accessory protein UreD [Thermohalobaculum sp.]